MYTYAYIYISISQHEGWGEVSGGSSVIPPQETNDLPFLWGGEGGGGGGGT